MQLFLYKRTSNFFNNKNEDSISQMANAICVVYGLSYEQVDSLSPKQFTKYLGKINRLFAKIQNKGFWQRSIILTDAKKITLGQFIDLMHFFQKGEIEAMEFIASTILKKRTDIYNDSTRLLDSDVRLILSDYIKFTQSFKELLDSYKGLFEIEENEDEEIEKPTPQKNSFMSKYGWIYSATEIAKHEGLKLNEAFELNIIQSLNTLSYLKAYSNYLKESNR